jgi:perosamine synthetase
MIPIASPVLGQKEMEYVSSAINSGWISSVGKYVTEFETRFSNFCGAKHGIATSSGTTALHLALASIGVGPGDEVIIPDLTMIATANSVRYTGATPILVDSELKTWNMDVGKIEAKISHKTKAIMVVHTYGHPIDMDPVLEVSRRHDLKVIEDAAEAHGAEYKGKRVGALGDAGCFSFYANKIITTGEGGMLTTNDDKIAEMSRLLRDQAYEKKRRFWHRYVGFNYRLTNVQAAIGLAQFERISEFIETRRRNAHTYNSMLRDVEGLVLPPEAQWAKNVYWMYSILLQKSFGIDRDTLMAKLFEHGIDTRPFFYPMHLQPAYSALYKGDRYPVADLLSETGMNLPSGNELTEEQVTRVCEVIRSLKNKEA